MPAKDLRIRQSVTIDKTLEEDVEDMPFEYMDPNEKQLTKRQRSLTAFQTNNRCLERSQRSSVIVCRGR